MAPSSHSAGMPSHGVMLQWICEQCDEVRADAEKRRVTERDQSAVAAERFHDSPITAQTGPPS